MFLGTCIVCKYKMYVTMYYDVGPILDNRLKENSWNPERVPSVVSFVSVCPSVRPCLCARGTDHIFWVRNIIFESSDPWNVRKKRIFLFFEIFIFTLFIGIFRFFPYITLVNFWFQATGNIFHLGMWYLGWENFVP